MRSDWTSNNCIIKGIRFNKKNKLPFFWSSLSVGMHQFQFESIPILGIDGIDWNWNWYWLELELELIEIDWNWNRNWLELTGIGIDLELTGIDWNWFELTRTDWNWHGIDMELTGIINEIDWNWLELLEFIEIGYY